MGKRSISILGICILAVFLLIGCNSAAATQELPTNTVPSSPTVNATEPPLPSLTPTAAPLPCTIAYDSDRDGNREIYLTNADGSNTVNLTNAPSDDFSPAFSPDGSRIAFVSNRGENQSIYVMNADGSGVRQLSDAKNSTTPNWSSDGQWIAYASDGDIYKIKADGSAAAIDLTNSPEEDLLPSWSPDNAKVAWLIKNQWGRNVYVMDADGSNVFQITNNNLAQHVEWTPDGRLFTNWGWDGQQEICQNCIVKTDGTGVLDAGGKDSVINYFPFWTDEGHRGGLAQTDRITGNNDIFVFDKSLPDSLNIGIGAINVTNNPADDLNPTSPMNCGKGWTVDEEALLAPVPTVFDPNKVLIGYAGDDPAQPQRKADFQNACDELHIRCVYGDLPTLLEKNVNAIVQNSSREKSNETAAAIETAKAKNIPVFVLEAEIEGPGVYNVTVDHAEQLSATLKWIFDKFGDAGDFAYFDYASNGQDAQAIQQIIAKDYPNIHVVTNDTVKYDFVVNKTYMDDLINDFPEIRGIWTNSGYNNIVLGVDDHASSFTVLPALNCEATKTGFFIWKDRLAKYPSLECIAVSTPPGIAYDAVYAAFHLVSGEKVKPSALGGQYGNSFYVDYPIVTKENLQEWMKKINYENDDFIPDQTMTPDQIEQNWFED
jgi:Periplasmic component of the Tol biopolymer transport system